MSRGEEIAADERAELLPRHDDVKLGKPQLWITFASLFLLLFCVAAQMSMMTTTQSAIAHEFRAYDHAAWLTSSYMIPVGCTTPLAGRLVTIFSIKRMLLSVGIGLSIGCLLTGLAPNLTCFFLGRAVCGIAAGALIPAAAILVLELASPKRRGLYIGIQNSSYTFGTALGGTIGGFLASRWSWREAFWFQVPLLMTATTGLFMALPKSAHISKKRFLHLDYLGVIFLSASLCTFLYSLSQSSFVPWAFSTSILCMMAFIGIELRVAVEPIVPVSLLRYPPLLYSCFATLLTMTARWIILFYAPVYAIAVWGWTPTEAGASLFPSSAGFVLGSLLSGHFGMRRSGSFYWQCLIAIACFASTLLLIHSATDTTSVWLYAVLILANGVGAGAVLNYTFAHVLYTLEDSTGQAIATSLLATFRGMAGSIGSTVGGGILVRTLEGTFRHLLEHDGPLTPEETRLVRQLKGAPNLPWQLEGVQREAAILSYRTAINRVILVGAALALLSLLCQAGTRRRSKPPSDLIEQVVDDE